MAAKRFGTSPLIGAIRAGRLDQVIAALDDGGDIEEADIHGFRGLPLRTACFNGNVPIIRTLLDRGADVNARTADGAGAPLRLAMRAGHMEIVALLIARNAEIPFDLELPPEILERAHGLSHTETEMLDMPALPFERATPSKPLEAPASSLEPHHDNLIEFVSSLTDETIEQVEVKGCYGVDTNILALDFEKAGGNWEKVTPAAPAANDTAKKTPD